MTNVKFYIDTDGEILAYFPGLKADNKGNFTSYAHIGQHSACSPYYVAPLRAANKDQYTPLLNELKGQGYNDLKVLNVNFDRVALNSNLWHNSNCDILEGHLNKDTFITYGVNIKDHTEFMEYYTGANYKPGSTCRSYSRHYEAAKIPAAYIEQWAELKAKYTFFKAVLHAYLVAALWANDIDGLTIYDLEKESEIKLTKGVYSFIEKTEPILLISTLTPDQIGHSLFLTQHRHGAGFFDYSIDQSIIDALTSAAQALPEYHIFSDADKVYAE